MASTDLQDDDEQTLLVCHQALVQELAILKQILFRNKNQHRRTKYFRYMQEVHRKFASFCKLDVHELVADAYQTCKELNSQNHRCGDNLLLRAFANLSDLRSSLEMVAEAASAAGKLGRAASWELGQGFFVNLMLVVLAMAGRCYSAGGHLGRRAARAHAQLLRAAEGFANEDGGVKMSSKMYLSSKLQAALCETKILEMHDILQADPSEAFQALSLTTYPPLCKSGVPPSSAAMHAAGNQGAAAQQQAQPETIMGEQGHSTDNAAGKGGEGAGAAALPPSPHSPASASPGPPAVAWALETRPDRAAPGLRHRRFGDEDDDDEGKLGGRWESRGDGGAEATLPPSGLGGEAAGTSRFESLTNGERANSSDDTGENVMHGTQPANFGGVGGVAPPSDNKRKKKGAKQQLKKSLSMAASSVKHLPQDKKREELELHQLVATSHIANASTTAKATNNYNLDDDLNFFSGIRREKEKAQKIFKKGEAVLDQKRKKKKKKKMRPTTSEEDINAVRESFLSSQALEGEENIVVSSSTNTKKTKLGQPQRLTKATTTEGENKPSFHAGLKLVTDDPSFSFFSSQSISSTGIKIDDNAAGSSGKNKKKKKKKASSSGSSGGNNDSLITNASLAVKKQKKSHRMKSALCSDIDSIFSSLF